MFAMQFVNGNFIINRTGTRISGSSTVSIISVPGEVAIDSEVESFREDNNVWKFSLRFRHIALSDIKMQFKLLFV